MLQSYLDVNVKTVSGREVIEFGAKERILSEAVCRMQFKLMAHTTNRLIRVGALSRVKLHYMMITASKYDDGTAKFIYMVGDSPGLYALSSPHIFRGSGQAQYFPDAPDKLYFTNHFSEDIMVDIYALWDTNQEPLPLQNGFRLFPDFFEVSQNGQTQFALTYPPNNSEDVLLFVNSVKQDYGNAKDYYVVGQNLFWTNNDFSLEIGDTLDVRYVYY